LAVLANKICDLMGDRATGDKFECSFYGRDMSSVPGFLSKMLFHNDPDVVVRPIAVDELARVLKAAQDEGVPVTPRAGATTAFMNAVPVKRGIVVDTTGMHGIINVDAASGYATVWAGSSWKETEEGLEDFGLAACSLPSSAPYSTVGGWFNMGGYGIGSIKYGCFHDQVRSAEVALAGGRVVTAGAGTEPPLSWFAGSEGTLGVVSKLEFKVRSLPEKQKNYLVEFDSVAGVEQALKSFDGLKGAQQPYNVHWTNGVFYGFLKELGYRVPCEKDTLLVTYEGKQADIEAGERAVQEVAVKTGGRLLDGEAADEEWASRYLALRIKRGGPTLLAAETVIPVSGLKKFCERLATLKPKMAAYGHGLDKNRIMILVMYHADETKSLEYLFLMAKTKIIYDAAIRVGGRPYGTGVWNSVYLKRVSDRQKLQEMKEQKKCLDPSGIINPGKLTEAPVFMNPTLFGIGTACANALSGLLGIGGGRS
jgi:glycolate oxidase